MQPMRMLAFLLFAAASSFAAAAEPIGYDGARHLLNRTGFGATDEEIWRFSALDRAAAVDRILSATRREASLRPPAFVDEPYESYRRARADTPEERMAAQRKLAEQGYELKAW